MLKGTRGPSGWVQRGRTSATLRKYVAVGLNLGVTSATTQEASTFDTDLPPNPP